MPRPLPRADVGIFGGSGFYSLFDSAEERPVETPYGVPSAPVAIGEIGGKRVAFIPRHGKQHELPPHRIPYRANLGRRSA
jgi:5'-methylthioadenosine phosphorylase